MKKRIIVSFVIILAIGIVSIIAVDAYVKHVGGKNIITPEAAETIQDRI